MLHPLITTLLLLLLQRGEDGAGPPTAPDTSLDVRTIRTVRPLGGSSNGRLFTGRSASTLRSTTSPSAMKTSPGSRGSTSWRVSI